MRKRVSICLATFLLIPAFASTSAAGDDSFLQLVDRIPLPGLRDGDFDHFAKGVDGHRLFLTAGPIRSRSLHIG